jgi:hypothetical protein
MCTPRSNCLLKTRGHLSFPKLSRRSFIHVTKVADMSAFDEMADGYALVANPARSRWYSRSSYSCRRRGPINPLWHDGEKGAAPKRQALGFRTCAINPRRCRSAVERSGCAGSRSVLEWEVWKHTLANKTVFAEDRAELGLNKFCFHTNCLLLGSRRTSESVE